ncbi:LOW QUALITY PROTEIN: hypothetical protein OSB04_029208 [Centaurea solstitialis]|uniref:Reverse transcriptase domain-containing protein n=1 Tax=Centaurea solstitialis TaxID=347529 RepID=A0AA38W1C6_9ASTR|nr:LOW QUALITY PROTEIN: hypothetical protein OSB04_029208 [Centaurea solstitialis]
MCKRNEPVYKFKREFCFFTKKNTLSLSFSTASRLHTHANGVVFPISLLRSSSQSQGGASSGVLPIRILEDGSVWESVFVIRYALIAPTIPTIVTKYSDQSLTAGSIRGKRGVWNSNCGIKKDLRELGINLNSMIQRNEVANRWEWVSESNKLFSVRSLRQLIDAIHLPTADEETDWTTNILLWQVLLNCLATIDNLLARGFRYHRPTVLVLNEYGELRPSYGSVFHEWSTPTYELGWTGGRPERPVLKTLGCRSARQEVRKVIGAAFIWTIWMQRYIMTFKGKTISEKEIFSDIQFLAFNWVKCRSRGVILSDGRVGLRKVLYAFLRPWAFLQAPFSDKEVKEAMWGYGGDKASGPDGFSFALIKWFWVTFGPDFCAAVKFFEWDPMLQNGCNDSFIALVPNINDPLCLRDFRPIHLMGCISKVISKVLANRLKLVIDSVISPEQTAFVKGRVIIFLFKVDFEKAFDNLNWNFLFGAMEQMGFETTWIRWVKCLISTARVSVLVNESPTEQFLLEKGTRRPVVPYLFIIAIEGLIVALEEAEDKGVFKGVKLPRNGPTISSHHYAYDALFLGEWDEGNIRNLKKILRCFYLSSGLQVNWDKISLTDIGVHPAVTADMSKVAGCMERKLPLIFLGMPIGISMSSMAGWSSCLEKFSKRLSSLKRDSLSIGGRRTLCKAVLGGLGVYLFSLFKAPKGILSALEKMRRNFLWGFKESCRKITWVAWDKTLNSIENKGLGIGSLKAINLALLAKWWWRFKTEEGFWRPLSGKVLKVVKKWEKKCKSDPERFHVREPYSFAPRDVKFLEHSCFLADLALEFRSLAPRSRLLRVNQPPLPLIPVTRSKVNDTRTFLNYIAFDQVRLPVSMGPLWRNVITAIHGPSGNLGEGPRTGVWGQIANINLAIGRANIDLSCLFFQETGSQTTKFWTNWWCGNQPLIAKFPHLAALDKEVNCLVSDRLQRTSQSISWRRPLIRIHDLSELEELTDLCTRCCLESGEDSWVWRLDASGEFSVASPSQGDRRYGSTERIVYLPWTTWQEKELLYQTGYASCAISTRNREIISTLRVTNLWRSSEPLTSGGTYWTRLDAPSPTSAAPSRFQINQITQIELTVGSCGEGVFNGVPFNALLAANDIQFIVFSWVCNRSKFGRNLKWHDWNNLISTEKLSWAKCNEIIGPGITCKSASFVIISVAISLGAKILEKLRIVRRWACFRFIVITIATILRSVKRQTPTFTPNRSTGCILYRKLLRALSVNVKRTISGWTTSTALWNHRNGQIEPVNKANVVEVLLACGVAGGIAPAPLHPTWPEPQSPLLQWKFPPSLEQPNRAQTRPDHGAGMLMVFEAWGASSNPVKTGSPIPVRVAGAMAHRRRNLELGSHIGALPLSLAGIAPEKDIN